MSQSESLAQEAPPLPPRGPLRRTPHACERCRVKKARCCGGTPCTKCRESGALCMYGEKYRAEGKVHPKGYVEMLERQHRLLISAIHTMYRKQRRIDSAANDENPDTTLEIPRTQDILQELGLIPPSRSLQSPSSSPPDVPATISDHQTVEDMELDLQSPIRSSPQNTLSKELGSWSWDSWLPLSPSDANALAFEVAAICDTPELATSTVMEKPQQLMTTTPILAGPDLTPQDCTMTFYDPLLYRTPWMLDDN